MRTNKSQSGSAHLIIIIILVVALLGALGFVFWQNFVDKAADSATTNTSDTTTTNAATSDKDNNELGLDDQQGIEAIFKNKYPKGNLYFENSYTLSGPNAYGYYTLGVGAIEDVDFETGGFMALFYKKGSTGDWRYFTGTQAELECSEYSSTELKQAYAGDECFNGNEKITVGSLL